MKRLLRHLSQLLPALLAFALLAFTLRKADLGRSVDLIQSLGWWIPVLLLPNLVAVFLETFGWWVTFSRLGPRPRFRSLFGVRFMTDAVMLGLPSGVVISESLQPYLLKRRCAVPFEAGIVASLGRKFLVVLSHGLVLALAAFPAWASLEHASRTTIGRVGLPWLILAGAAALVLTAFATAAIGVHGRLADRAHRVLDRFGGRWLGSWLERNALRFQRADQHLEAFFRHDPGGLVLPLVTYLLAWLARGVETLFFLRLLGVTITLSASTVMETSLILVRALAVPIPAGLGVQDAGYVLSLKALGVADAATVGAAFVLLKRGKDLFWIAFGFLLLLMGRERGERVVPGVAEPAEAPADGSGSEEPEGA